MERYFHGSHKLALPYSAKYVTLGQMKAIYSISGGNTDLEVLGILSGESVEDIENMSFHPEVYESVMQHALSLIQYDYNDPPSFNWQVAYKNKIVSIPSRVNSSPVCYNAILDIIRDHVNAIGGESGDTGPLQVLGVHEKLVQVYIYELWAGIGHLDIEAALNENIDHLHFHDVAGLGNFFLRTFFNSNRGDDQSHGREKGMVRRLLRAFPRFRIDLAGIMK